MLKNKYNICESHTLPEQFLDIDMDSDICLAIIDIVNQDLIDSFHEKYSDMDVVYDTPFI